LRQLAEQHRTAETASVAVRCARPDGSIVDPALWSPAVSSPPAPVRPVTAGRAGCVTGPDRPVIGTTHFRVSATAGPGEELVYEHGPLDSGDLVDSSGSPVLEFGPGDLAPGVTYHWRARVDDPAAWTDPAEDDRGWSPWCEFSVSAGAVD
jgi:hypothetical protein